jgi:hypothetical protein
MEAYEAGTSQKFLGERFGISPETVRKYIHDERKRRKSSCPSPEK